MFIVQHMSAPPVTINADMLIPHAREILKAHNFRHLPVVDFDNRLVGMVTDRDIRSSYPSSVATEEERAAGLDQVGKTPVSAIMSRHFVTLGTTSTLDDALFLFDHEKVGALPVLDDDKGVIGIFSIRDLMKAYKKLFGLGERGSAMIVVDDDGREKLLTRIVSALEEQNVRFTRLVRTEKQQEGRPAGCVYVRVNTYNISAVHTLLRKAGFTISVPVVAPLD